MSCKSCTTGGCGSVNVKDKNAKVAGCQSNGACGTGGCNKMNVFDWLSNMDVPTTMRYNVVEIKFKGGRKDYFRNVNNLELYTGDFVVVEMPTGHHVGSISLQGELVRLQMIKKNIKDEDAEIRSIIRKATEKDMEKHEQAIARDLPTMYRTREIVKDLKLQMKLSDVEFQSDNTKATFFYSAEDRVDFRELIKLLAGEFKIRVEMRQISLRQEAARIGGIGSCGRELCCSTWLTDFRNIPTSAARYQNLSLNPTKLSGQCGRLKCCLNYELETYMDALSDVPQVEKSLKTQKGDAVLQKTDIFRKIMWFSYNNDSNWVSISMTQVMEIQKMNEKSVLPNSLEDLQLSDNQAVEKVTAINRELDRLDKKYSNNKNRNKNKPSGNRPNNDNRQSNEARPVMGNKPSGNKPTENRQPNEQRPLTENKQSGNKPVENRQPNEQRPPIENKPSGNKSPENRPPNSHFNKKSPNENQSNNGGGNNNNANHKNRNNPNRNNKKP